VETDPNIPALEGQRAAAPAAGDDGATPVDAGDGDAQPSMQPEDATAPMLRDRRRPKA
jgi:hypothetical protein